MKIIAASGSGYERDLEVALEGVVIYCTTKIFNNYVEGSCADNDLIGATIKEDSFSMEYSVLCQGSDILFEQPLPGSPSSVLGGVCIEKREEGYFVVRNSLLGVVLVSFDDAVDLSVGDTVFVRGELHVDSALINLGMAEVSQLHRGTSDH